MLYLPAFTSPPEPGHVYNVDALTLLRAMPTGSVDVLCTDLPYGVNKAGWDADIPLDWVEEGWRVAKRMLIMPGGTNLIRAGMAIGRYREVIALYATNGMTRGSICFGNWIQVLACGDWQWEPRQNVLPFAVSTAERIDHPSPKPLTAMLKLLTYYTKPGELILDPFCGSGTTLVAARALGRNYIGGDISYLYVAQSRDRLRLPFESRQAPQNNDLTGLPMFDALTKV